MIKHLIAFVASIAIAATAAQSSDLTDMTDQEREALRKEIRAYLLENPTVLVEAIEVLNSMEAEQTAVADSELVAANAELLFGDGDSWVGGNPEGDIVMVEFIDYRCGYCRRAYNDVETLIANDGNIRFIVKEFPILGQESLNSARLAIAVFQTHGNAAYKAVHDALISFTGPVDDDFARRFAADHQLDVDAIISRANSPAVDSVIAANHDLAGRLGIEGTPAFVFGDLLFRGWLPLEEMEKIVVAIRNR